MQSGTESLERPPVSPLARPVAIVAALGLSMRDLQPPDDSDTDKTLARRSRLGVLSGGVRNGSSAVFPAARDAVETLEKKHGPRADAWTYHDADSEPIGMVIRWNNPDGSKRDIRPVSRRGDTWIIGAMPKPRPLYRLPELLTADRVLIVEGEKAAEALRTLGLIATTSAGGCNAADATDWLPLENKACTIWRDKDTPGAHYADDVARLVASHAPGATIKRIEPCMPGLAST
ncbi:MAG: hypothetical protein IIB14_10455 [Chloroflexi bacterium]|nr:hypothetical protein [Chloroflexota bacterium]